MAHKGLTSIKRVRRSLREIWVNRMKRMTTVIRMEKRKRFNSILKRE
jgi:hypothetical protein